MVGIRGAPAKEPASSKLLCSLGSAGRGSAREDRVCRIAPRQHPLCCEKKMEKDGLYLPTRNLPTRNSRSRKLMWPPRPKPPISGGLNRFMASATAGNQTAIDIMSERNVSEEVGNMVLLFELILCKTGRAILGNRWSVRRPGKKRREFPARISPEKGKLSRNGATRF